MNILLMAGALIPAENIVDVTWSASPSVDPFDKSMYDSDVEDVLDKYSITFHLKSGSKYENKIIIDVATDDVQNISRAILSMYMLWSDKGSYVLNLENCLQEAEIEVTEYAYY